ncbi:hypothetical protein ID866_7316 [Astraeus odoratus]|nr:hypothetical protein ID866_7316 [Astraeus odoratus]
MDELAVAWTALSHLESQERILQEKLTDVHRSIELQRGRIENIMRSRPSLITTFPTELLLQIFELIVQDESLTNNIHPKLQLTMVSRYWRDVILTCSSFWTRIQLAPEWPLPLLEAHITRSGQCPLDIVILNWNSNSSKTVCKTFRQQLGIVIQHASRWRSLEIQANAGTLYALFALEKVYGMAFPSLTRVSVDRQRRHGAIDHGWGPLFRFLRFESIPGLKGLNLGDLIPSEDLHVSSTLTEFTLSVSYPSRLEAPSFLYNPSLRGLKSLTLQGWTKSWQLVPDSIHLPLLEHFVCEVSNPKQLLHALSAPKLTHFQYQEGDERPSTVFSGLKSKFSNVHHFTLSIADKWSRDPGGAQSLCLAIPAVRSAVLNEGDLEAFFGLWGMSCAADVWEHLESLSVEGSYCDLPNIRNCLVWWLGRRQRLQKGKPKLKIRFDFLDDISTLQDSYGCGSPLSFCAAMREYCDLEYGQACHGSH